MDLTDGSCSPWCRPTGSREGLGPLLAGLLIAWLLAPAVVAQPPEEGEEPAGAGTSEVQEGEPEQPEAEEELDDETPGRVEEHITVTGTRVRGRTTVDTPAPVDYIEEETIRRAGPQETGKLLQLVAPSFNFSTTTISDGTDIIRPATLRALGPDQVLVLVNGKRRHQQALLNVQQTIARGSAGYDVNAIPASAIDHVEVLRDGAAAQYGSDAIAGVINIILKDDAGTSEVTLDAGQYYVGDGESGLASVNSGFAIGEEGFFNVTAEYRDRAGTNRAGPATTNLLGWYTEEEFAAGAREVKLVIGDADSEQGALWVNSEVPLGDGELYAFGGWTGREGDSFGFFRGPGDGRTVPAIYPDGFLPNIRTEPEDLSAVIGYRGDLPSTWSYDVAVNYGSSEFRFREENTVNVSYWFEPVDPSDPTGERFGRSPTAADTGTLELDMLGLTFDLRGEVDWGIGAGPLYLATGAEYRQEGYQITPGDEVSYEYGRNDDRSIVILDQNGSIAQPGTQGFPGWSPREAVDDDRDSVGVFVDAEAQLAERFLAGAAVRWEDYSDFGSTVTGKLSGRYDLNPSFSLRGTASTGFRAPGVQQLFYSQRSTNLNAAGVLTDTLTARQGGPVTQAFGVPALDEETSENYSLGFVAKPNERFRLTIDLFRIDIEDRIVFSSNIQPEAEGSCGTPFDPALCPIRAILDPFGVGQVLFFTNAIDTETDGIDVVAAYDHPFANSLLSLVAALHFNDTEVTERRSSSAILPAEVLFDDAQVTLIEEGQPGEHYTLSGTYHRGPAIGTLRFNYFGDVAGEGFTPGFAQEWDGKWLTDVILTYELLDGVELTVGGLNVFDEFPDRWDPQQAFPFPQLGFTYGWETLPFGINGGYYFTRLRFRFDH